MPATSLQDRKEGARRSGVSNYAVNERTKGSREITIFTRGGTKKGKWKNHFRKKWHERASAHALRRGKKMGGRYAQKAAHERKGDSRRYKKPHQKEKVKGLQAGQLRSKTLREGGHAWVPGGVQRLRTLKNWVITPACKKMRSWEKRKKKNLPF